jgi:hypothetical protein
MKALLRLFKDVNSSANPRIVSTSKDCANFYHPVMQLNRLFRFLQ